VASLLVSSLVSSQAVIAFAAAPAAGAARAGRRPSGVRRSGSDAAVLTRRTTASGPGVAESVHLAVTSSRWKTWVGRSQPRIGTAAGLLGAMLTASSMATIVRPVTNPPMADGSGMVGSAAIVQPVPA
jgi:hypothetical protein